MVFNKCLIIDLSHLLIELLLMYTIFRPITIVSSLYFSFILWQLKMIFSILLYLRDYVKALFTLVHVYYLGIIYVIYEFFEDCRTGVKMTSRKMLLNNKIEKWTRILKQMRTDKFDDSGNVDSSKLVAVITGADGTIGSELLKYLLAMDFNVFAVGLSPPTNQFQNLDNLHFIKCDLGNINEVFAAVESIQLSSDRIDLLILNAAMFLSPKIGWLPYRREMIIGAQIIERHLAVNVLANAQLFASLSQRLEQSVLSSGRAIFVSSCSARAGDLSLLLKKQDERFWCRHLNGYKSYADSKLLLSAYVQYLNKVLRSRDSQISVASVHPGVVPGKFYKNVFWPFRSFINWILAPFMRTPLQAATQILDIAFSPSLDSPNNSNNLYYENGVPSKINALQNQENIWLYGRCVREMIVDNDEESLSFNINTGNFDENSKQKQLEKSSAEFFERLLSEAGAI
uniref:Uncharacterized protein n=1 Tax=Meloidogyne enterolobii TaxID=390850 RepID=A0A6V7XGU3_MELEN|nr:unnamed protein product [Meloidogyne enterolobii]